VAHKPFVVYWNNIPSPYMVDRFNALADRGSFEFEAWFNERNAPDRSWIVDESTWRFRYRYIPAIAFLGRRVHFPAPLFGRNPPDVLASLYAEPVFILGWAVARVRGTRTCFRVLKTFDRWVARHPAKEAMKRFLFSRVDAIETTGEDGRRYAMRYGAHEDRIFLATHTFDVSHFTCSSIRANNRRDRLRAELGIVGTAFLYVGRLWHGKGLEFLIDAYAIVQRKSSAPMSLIIVGDGPQEKALRTLCQDNAVDNVIFAGFVQREDLPCYYAIADVFVFPTLGDPYGLVVDEAMACSLPIVSTSAAGEIRDRIEEGVNGFIVPPADSQALADRMLRLAQDPELRRAMGRNSAEKIASHTPERWAEDFERIVLALLSDGRASS